MTPQRVDRGWESGYRDVWCVQNAHPGVHGCHFAEAMLVERGVAGAQGPVFDYAHANLARLCCACAGAGLAATMRSAEGSAHAVQGFQSVRETAHRD